MIENPYETKTFAPRIGLTLLGLVALLAVVAVLGLMVVLAAQGRVSLPPGGALGLLVALPVIVVGAVLVVRRLVRPRPVLVLAPSGLTPTFSPEVPWSRISHLSAITMRGHRFLLVHLYDEAGYLEQVTGVRRRLLVANQRLCRAAIALNMRDLGLPIEQVTAEIEGRRLRFGGS